MTLGPVVANLAGERVGAGERDMLRHPNVGGVILFARNYRDPAGLRALCEEIRDVAGRPLLVCVDQEGGRVQRFREAFTALPPPGRLGVLYDADPQGALVHARETALTMALQLREQGVDLSFMPLGDLDRGLCQVIGDRAFHRDPEIVHALCRAWCEGMRAAGMAAVVKHFPGHGGVRADSHLETPVDPRDMEALENADLLPFARLIADGVEGVMTAHVQFPAIDEALPTFSLRWIDGVLRGDLGFAGVVFSDDLTMAGAGVAGSLPQRASAALQAGCDALLVCNDPAATRTVVETLETVEPARSLASLAGRPIDGAREALERRVADFAPALEALVSDRPGSGGQSA